MSHVLLVLAIWFVAGFPLAVLCGRHLRRLGQWDEGRQTSTST